MTTEKKDIEGYEGRYKVDREGNVYSCLRGRESLLKPISVWMGRRENKSYALKIKLYNAAKVCVFKKVSRVVAEAFIPNPKGLTDVKHVSSNLDDNSVSNLVWFDTDCPIHRAKVKANKKEAQRRREKAKSAARQEAKARYYEANKEQIEAERVERNLKVKQAKRDRERKRNKRRWVDHARREYVRQYNAENKAKRAAYMLLYNKVRRVEDPEFKLRYILRRRTNTILRKIKVQKTFQSHVRFLGCTVKDLREHIESQFEPWMSWENHGAYGWHIDHIKPLASFNLSDPKQFAEACHYTNLRPLHWHQNLSKGAKVA